jgi:hypothetical protein
MLEGTVHLFCFLKWIVQNCKVAWCESNVIWWWHKKDEKQRTCCNLYWDYSALLAWYMALVMCSDGWIVNSSDDQPKQLRMGSISSSISELYHQCHIHINVLKWTGVIMLLGLTTSTLGVREILFMLGFRFKNCLISRIDSVLIFTYCGVVLLRKSKWSYMWT